MKKQFTSLVLLIASPSLWACSTCMVGDPTMTLMGVEKPFENRLRVSIDYLQRDEALGQKGFNRKEIDERRYSLNLAYAPNRRWMIGANIPWVQRDLETFSLAEQDVNTLGDITLNFKNYLQKEENFQKHMYGLMGGIRLPTAEEQEKNGQALDFDVQAGIGATTVNLGGWYSHFKFPWMFYTSAAYHVSNEGFQDFEAGNALAVNTAIQYASNHKFAFQLGLEGRWSEKDQFDSVNDPDSGGTIGYIAPGFVYTLKEDLLINMAVKFVVLDDLSGDHEEGTIYTLGVTYDINLH